MLRVEISAVRGETQLRDDGFRTTLTDDAAEQAVSLSQVEYEELPPVFDAEEALAPDAPILHPEPEQYYPAGKMPALPHLHAVSHATSQKGDDVDGLFAEAYLVVEDAYT